MADGMQLTAREEQARRIAETLQRQLGPTNCALMAAPDVVEILLNPDGSLWVDRLGRGMERAGTMVPHTAEALIATVASTMRTAVTRENPILECELPLSAPFNGARFEALIPPIVSPGPAFAIRRQGVGRLHARPVCHGRDHDRRRSAPRSSAPCASGGTSWSSAAPAPARRR